MLGLATLRLKKLMALVPTTDELLDDANALTTYLPQKVALSIRWKANESIRRLQARQAGWRPSIARRSRQFARDCRRRRRSTAAASPA